MTIPLSPTPGLIYLLAALTAMAPLAIDAYLPALPAMAQHFGSTMHQAELSLSVFLAGFAIGQLIGGPVSDHFGRRGATGSGISLFCLATLGIVFSETMLQIWLFRALQAIGGGLAVVNSAAVIRDLSRGQDSARHLSNMALVMMLAPLLAPLLGMLLLKAGGWRLIFDFLLVYGLIVGLALMLRLPETRRHDEGPRPGALARYMMVLRHRHALGYVLAQCFAVGGMFTFITASPAVYMGHFGVSASLYPFLFAVNVLSMIVANRLNLRLLQRHRPQTLLIVGQTAQIASGVLMLAYIGLSDTASIVLLVPLVMLFIGAMGLIVANATAATVEFFPHNSATATAVLGAAGFGTGAVSGGLVGLFGGRPDWSMAATMLGCALLACLLRWLMQRDYAGSPAR